MKNTNKGLGALVTGTLMAGAILGASNVNANEIFAYNDLGSGSELRADLLNASNTGFKSPEGKCGEAKADEKAEAKAAPIVLGVVSLNSSLRLSPTNTVLMAGRPFWSA